MPYRYRDPAPVLDNLLGTAAAAGGLAYFYVLGDVNTPKDTYQDYALTTPNPNPIQLDANGRFPDPVWLNGDYTYELKAANGSSIVNPTDIRPEIAPGQALPDPVGHSGEFVQSNGTGFEMSGPVWMLPDPTGSAGQMLVVNSTGDGYILQAQPEPPTPDIVVETNSTTAGGGGALKEMTLRGTGIAPQSGTNTTQLAVTFTPAFKSGTVPFVAITPSNAQAGGPVVPYTSGPPTAAGFTAVFDVAEGSSGNQNITSPVNFAWMAVGVIDG